MSSEVDHDGPHLESGLAALRQCPEFRGPIDPVEEHDHANDHVALLYDDRDHQLATVAAFLREGLDRGERCLYVHDDNPRSAVLDAFHEAGIDVDDALESGALTVHSPDETYRRTGSFDREEMVTFWKETLATATDDGYPGIRAAAEMTWALKDETSADALVEYEAVLNECYAGEEYVVCCQYNTERFSSSVLRDVVRTHPHLVEDDVIHDNVYYTSPEELVASDRAAGSSGTDRRSEGDLEGEAIEASARVERPEGELDRMLHALRERTDAKAELQEHKQYLRRLNETTADGDCTFEETVERLLELGCERFDLRGGALSHLSSRDDGFVAEVAVGPDIPDRAAPLPTQPSEGCFCRSAIQQAEPTAVADASEAGWGDDPVFEDSGVASYLGVRVTAGADPYGTLWFYDTAPREEPFSEDEQSFLQLMARWVSSELERTERDRAQRELYEITADTELSFDEKLDAVLELGRDHFDVDVGGLARIDPARDRFEVEVTSGDHEHLTPGQSCPLSETYCQAVLGDGDVATVSGTDCEAYEGKLCYERFGVRTYLGAHLEVDGEVDRTFWFASNEPREEPFSDAERTFLHLMGQWVTYELERQQHEADLERTVDRLQQSNDRLKQFAYAASHDLQEPLRMISSYLQLLEREYGEELDDEAAEYIDFAVDGADRMRSMVDDLLTYSRIEQGDETFTRVDCEVILDRVTDDLQVQIDERDADVVVDALPTIEADPEQLHQLFRNLVSNAVKYAGDEPPTVEVTAEDCGDHWAFAVSDDGIGIDPEKTDRIFEVFQRLHNDDEYSGTGIGLALCQEIVEHHGGDIEVDSEPGVGSTFGVTLPKRRQ